MNFQYGCTVNATGKKETRSSAALALVVGLVLAFSGAAAWAIGEPIPGIDIVVKKNPGGIVVSAPTGPDGTYQFTGLERGNYDLSVAGKRVQTITVGANRSISGVLSSEPGGKASISFNGRTAPVLLPGGKDRQLASIEQLFIRIDGPSPPPQDGDKTAHDKMVAKVKPGGNPSTMERPAVGLSVPERPALAERLAEPSPQGGDKPLPGVTKPVPGVDIVVRKNPGGIVASAPTDSNGAFHFTKLPAGEYEITLPGQSARSVSVGPGGTFGGKVMRGSDGVMRIFDRWGNALLDAPANKKADTPDQAAGKPVAKKPDTGFGSGSTPGGFPGGGPGAMVPAGPMSPGAGGPAGAMGPGAIRR